MKVEYKQSFTNLPVKDLRRRRLVTAGGTPASSTKAGTASTWPSFCFERWWCLRYLANLDSNDWLELESGFSFSSLELELWLEESRLAICEANCLRRSSLYLAIRLSEMEAGAGWLLLILRLWFSLLLRLWLGLVLRLSESQKKR